MKYFLWSFLLVCGCQIQKQDEENFVNTTPQKSCYLYNNCFIIKPVTNSSPDEDPKDFNYLSSKEYELMARGLKQKNNPKIDSLMDYVTGYSHQKTISIDFNCFSQLHQPDSTFLIEIFLNSMYNTNSIISEVIFDKKYNKNILNFGTAFVYEYTLKGVVEVAPHNIFLIIKDVENRFEKDYKGFAFCSYGIRWNQVDGDMETFSFVDRVRNGKDYEVLMYYDKNRFIPVGHRKIGTW